MPEGLEQGLTPQDLADLFAYLQQGPAGFGTATPEQITRARGEFSPSPFKITAAAAELDYPGWLGRLPLFHCRQTDGKGQVSWEAQATASTNSRSLFRFPAALGLRSQPEGSFALKLNDQPLLDFDVTLDDQSWLSADGKVRLTYTALEKNEEDSDGVLEIEVPNGLLHGTKAEFTVAGSASNSQRWFGLYQLPDSKPKGQ